MSTPIQQATEALQQGKRQEAINIITAFINETKEKHGAQSPEYAASEFELAKILVALGDMPRAAQALQRAAAVPATEGPAKHAQLAYITNLGEVVARLGQLDDAEKIHTAGLTEREKVFGKGSAGYAVGEAPLAEVLLSKGKFDEAEALAESALAALWKAGNPQAVAVVALRAAVRGAKYGDERPLLEPFAQLPPQLQVELIRLCLVRVQNDRPEASLAVLTELRERMEDAEAHTEIIPRVVAAISQAAIGAEAHSERLEALRWLYKHFDEAKDERQSLEALMGIALAQDAADELEAAETTYKEALARAEKLGAVALSRVLRNKGIFLSQRERADEARTVFEESVKHGESGDDKEVLGNALLAQGIHAQRSGKPEEAKPLIEKALTLLPASHPDTLFARAYLNSVNFGRPFDSENPKTTVANMLETLVRPNIPEGLLAGIDVRSLEKMNLNITLARQPTQEEQNLLGRVLGQAVGLLRGNIRIQRRKGKPGEEEEPEEEESEGEAENESNEDGDASVNEPPKS
jgi:tetratricopeptide (TPR) repeat protein